MREYFKKVATEDHSYAAINGEYTAFINAIAAESYEYDDEQAFSDTALEMAPYAWHQTYTYPGAPRECGVTTPPCSALRLLSSPAHSRACPFAVARATQVYRRKRNQPGIN